MPVTLARLQSGLGDPRKSSEMATVLNALSFVFNISFLSNYLTLPKCRLLCEVDYDIGLHVNPKIIFRGTNGGFGRGVRGPPPENCQNPVLQMVQSQLFLTYICEYN